MEATAEPPSKKIKVGQEFIDLIEECYDMLFGNKDGPPESERARLNEGIAQIRKILEQVHSSQDLSFGPTQSKSKIAWGKCVSIMLETGTESLRSVQLLTGRLSAGAGLLSSTQ